MTIQISLTIWTIIGFCTLAFVLNRFLFQPILKVMDERNAKISEDRNQKQALLEERESMRRQAELARLEAQKTAAEAGEKALEIEKERTEKLLSEKIAEYDQKLEQLRKNYETEARDIQTSLTVNIDDLADRYVKALIQ